MLKWILLGVAALVIIVAGTCYYGYRQITSGGGTAAVAIAATPERAWHWLNNPDSLAAIADSGATVTSSADADTLAVGDTLTVRRIEGESRPDSGKMRWLVNRIDPNMVRTMISMVDSAGSPLLERIDSVVALGGGDSVRVSSTFLAPALAAKASDSTSPGGIGGMILTGGAKVMMGAMRYVSQKELDRLKTTLEQR